MRTLIDEYALESAWTVALMLLFLSAPARGRAQDPNLEQEPGWETVIQKCSPDHVGCEVVP